VELLARIRPQQHSGEVLWHALAEILLALGIESRQDDQHDDTRQKVAYRLRSL